MDAEEGNDGNGARVEEEDATMTCHIGVDREATEADEEETQPSRPEAKYKMLDRVLARDEDGLQYHAIVRRALYGAHTHKQVQVGMISNQKELDECMKEIDEGQAENQPIWHYFVHFLKWKVNWDRWVSEDDIIPLTEENNNFADKLLAEHRSLQKQFKADLAGRRRGGSGSKPVVDGGAFLRTWTARLRQLQSEKDQACQEKQQEYQDGLEMNIEMEAKNTQKEEEETVQSPSSRRSKRAKKTTPTWSEKQFEQAKREESERQNKKKHQQLMAEKAKQEKAAAAEAKTKQAKSDGEIEKGLSKQMVQKEQRLRKSDLSCVIGVTNSASGNALLMHDSSVVLNKFKITLPFSLKKELVEEWEVISTCHMVPNLPAKITVRQALKQYLDSKLAAIATSKSETEVTDGSNGDGDGEGQCQKEREPAAGEDTHEDTDKMEVEPVAENDSKVDVATNDVDGDKKENSTTEVPKSNNEWEDMIDGIALFFDQSLSFRLLYHQELPQYNLIMRMLNKRQQQMEKQELEELRKKRLENEEFKQELQMDMGAPSSNSEQRMKVEAASADSYTPNVEGAVVGETESRSKFDKGSVAKDAKPDDKPSEVASSTTATPSDENSNATASAKTPFDDADISLDATPADIYGCEHLLRLFLRLPALLADDQEEQRKRRLKRKAAADARRKHKMLQLQQLSSKARSPQDLEDEDEKKVDDGENAEIDEEDEFAAQLQQRNVRIIAKVNDLVRFLHKHQSTLFAQSYRRMNLLEEREQTRLHKRRIAAAMKRQEEQEERVNDDGSSSEVAEAIPEEEEEETGGGRGSGGFPTNKRPRNSDDIATDSQTRKKKKGARVSQ